MISYLGTAPACLLFARMNPVNIRKKSQQALGKAFSFPPPLQRNGPSSWLARDAGEGEEEVEAEKAGVRLG